MIRSVCASSSSDTARTRLRGRVSAAVALITVTATLAGCDLLEAAQSTPKADPATFDVVAVVDGDTIDVRTEEGTERVRLIGLDTPEIARDGSQDECYAQEARDVLDALVYGRQVQLAADPTQDDRDKYGRLLRHVYVDGQSAALTLIEAGAAHEYTYDVPYEHQAEHIAAEDQAQADRLGLWGEC